MFRFWDAVTRPLLDTLDVSSIVEIGMAKGHHTELLLPYAQKRGIVLHGIDPVAPDALRYWQAMYPETLRFHHALSLQALPEIGDYGAVLIDGDHNWYTVISELRVLDRYSSPDAFPLVLLHDVGWPYARRDMYADPSQIPGEYRRPCARGGVTFAGKLSDDAGLSADSFHAIDEGGEKNGILCAVEDFLKYTQRKLSFVSIPGLSGLGIIVDQAALRSNPRLADFFGALERGIFPASHLEKIEHGRITALIQNTVLEQKLKQEILEDSERKALHDEFVGRLDRTSERVVSLIQELRAAEQKSQSLDAALRRIERSRSWTMTAPIRRVEAWLRRYMKRSPQPSGSAPATTERPTGISVIVASRNYGRYLQECLASILSQTVPPFEVLYCDDGSDDDSVRIASAFSGVRVLSRRHRGAPAIRNTGAKAAKGSHILFVDGDDVLPHDFLEKHVLALQKNPQAVFAYGPAQAFGLHDTLWDAPEWSRDTLWLQNYVNTSALMVRDAFLKCGGWREDLKTLWDWDLALRLSQFGPGIRSDATLLYRQHAQSWSRGFEYAMSEEELGRAMGEVRRDNARSSVCAVFTGRLPELFPAWLDALAESVRRAAPRQKPELVLLDCSPEGFLASADRHLSAHRDAFEFVRIIRSEARPDAGNAASFLANGYNALLGLSPREVTWFVSEDIIVPPHAYGQLLRQLTDGIRPKAAVSALYRSRYVGDIHAHILGSNGLTQAAKMSEPGLNRVDFSGADCLMIFRPIAPHQFRPHWRGDIPAHDWAWCEDVATGGQQVWVDASVSCRLHVTTEEFVTA